ncbi:MAG: S46 family peptidase, partial [Bacteroidota bacterium]|nr:S46 family peptidase [Bacteroidota bacterium]
MVKKIISTFLVFNFVFAISLKADEGMWLPLLLKQLNESDMQKNGLKLSAEDIYSINKSSLKDAIVHFGGGCTAEIISDKGLMLTNHHCGYGQIQAHSTVQNDLLTNGFWAMDQSQELKNPGLTATFIIRMEDVTAKVFANVSDTLSDAAREKKINEAIVEIQNAAVKGTHYGAYIRPFYYGNEYYMFITETFRDVRLVGAPPSSIGKFGGDTDNWMWPRHTGDFSIFRIYANKDNKPADYSADNVPYKPKNHLTISMKDVEKGDFTMVYGFPGRTNEYLSSYAVNMIMNESDPAKVKIREARLSIMDADMRSSDVVRIQYSSKYASLANYYKKWIGEINGLKKLDALNKKKLAE